MQSGENARQCREAKRNRRKSKRGDFRFSPVVSEPGGTFLTLGGALLSLSASLGGEVARGDRNRNIPFPAIKIVRDDVDAIAQGLLNPKTAFTGICKFLAY